MGSRGFNKTIDAIGQSLALIENYAHGLAAQLETLCTKAELSKIDILKRGLENRVKLLARQAGVKSVVTDGRKLKVGLVAATAGIVLGGLLGRDGSSALIAGMSGFDGMLQELGKTKWAASLDRDLVVVPGNEITPGRTWVTLESLLLALEELKEKAYTGEEFGNLGAIAAKVKEGQTSLMYLFIVKHLDTRIDSK